MKAEARFRIVVVEPLTGVTYAVQNGRSDFLLPARSTASELVFEFPLTVADIDADPPRLIGRFAQGPAKKRFVYVNSGTAAGPACASVPLLSSWAVRSADDAVS
ncbi:MAG: DUF5990 family protein [Gammaproteobacteria bacterium]|jgi:hypothetical protein